MTAKEIQKLITDWENAGYILQYFLENPARLERLLELVFDDTQHANWRAAWILDKINTKNPMMTERHLPQIREALYRTKDHSKMRHYLKIISLHEIPRDSVGLLLDRTMTIFTSACYPIAVRAHAMQILYQIAQIEPELKPELIQVIEHEMEFHPSAGIKSRGKRILSQLYLEINT